MDAVRNEDYCKKIAGIKNPMLIISGRNDMLFSGKVNKFMHKQILGSKIIFFEKSKHYPFIEEKTKFTEVINKFIN